MSTPVTSPGWVPESHDSLKGQWREFFTFLRRPQLPDRAAGITRATLTASLRLLTLDFAMMFVLLSILFVAIAMGLEVPETALADMELTAGLIALVVIGAPLGEEILFRSWLSGRPGHVLAILAIVIGALGIPIIAGLAGVLASSEAGPVMAGGAGLLIGGCLALWALRHFRGHGPMPWFAAIFPVILPLSALAFASVHLFNYEEEVSLLLWLFVLPQFLLALVCAYARVNFGLWSAMLIHALHNGTIMALVLAAESAGLGG